MSQKASKNVEDPGDTSQGPSVSAAPSPIPILVPPPPPPPMPAPGPSGEQYPQQPGQQSQKPPICLDFFMSSCTHYPCNYLHENDPEQFKKVKINFCHDFQNNGKCERPFCKFIHGTVDEEKQFLTFGELPEKIMEGLKAKYLWIVRFPNAISAPPPPPPPPPTAPPPATQQEETMPQQYSYQEPAPPMDHQIPSSPMNMSPMASPVPNWNYNIPADYNQGQAYMNMGYYQQQMDPNNLASCGHPMPPPPHNPSVKRTFSDDNSPNPERVNTKKLTKCPNCKILENRYSSFVNYSKIKIKELTDYKEKLLLEKEQSTMRMAGMKSMVVELFGNPEPEPNQKPFDPNSTVYAHQLPPTQQYSGAMTQPQTSGMQAAPYDPRSQNYQQQPSMAQQQQVPQPYATTSTYIPGQTPNVMAQGQTTMDMQTYTHQPPPTYQYSGAMMGQQQGMQAAPYDPRSQNYQQGNMSQQQQHVAQHYAASSTYVPMQTPQLMAQGQPSMDPQAYTHQPPPTYQYGGAMMGQQQGMQGAPYDPRTQNYQQANMTQQHQQQAQSYTASSTYIPGQVPSTMGQGQRAMDDQANMTQHYQQQAQSYTASSTYIPGQVPSTMGQGQRADDQQHQQQAQSYTASSTYIPGQVPSTVAQRPRTIDEQILEFLQRARQA